MWRSNPSNYKGRHKPAAICRRGHTQTTDLDLDIVSERCSICGAKVLTACPHCDERIPGRYAVPGRVVTQVSQIPDFCDKCGSPFPWASRQARVYELENILDEQNLDEATRLTVSEQLQALRDPDLPENEQRRRWQTIKKLAPGILDAGKQIVVTVVSAEIKRQLGL